jgi:hypothetical protein
VLHPPQLFGSVRVLAHAPPHSVVPLGHWHAPPFATLAQVCPVTVQPPQAAPPAPHDEVDWPPKSSHVVLLLQHPLQPDPVLQTHWLAEHVVPEGQTLPQVPQLLRSIVVSVHVVEHSVIPAEQLEAHEYMLPEREQSGVPAPHTTPHAPQLLVVLIGVSHPWLGPPSPQCA